MLYHRNFRPYHRIIRRYIIVQFDALSSYHLTLYNRNIQPYIIVPFDAISS
jgi:hypothetical protein